MTHSVFKHPLATSSPLITVVFSLSQYWGLRAGWWCGALLPPLGPPRSLLRWHSTRYAPEPQHSWGAVGLCGSATSSLVWWPPAAGALALRLGCLLVELGRSVLQPLGIAKQACAGGD